MKEFFHSVKFKIILGIIALLIGVMLYAGTRLINDPGMSFFGAIFSPIQEFSANISSKVTSSLDTFINAKKYHEENEQLKKQLGELYNEVVDYDKIKSENEQLRQVIGLKKEFPDYVFSPPCSIIAKTTNDRYGSFVIDKGLNDDISPYDPVITAEGLVGVVTKVSATSARVQTILSPDTPVGAYCVRTKDTGVVSGDVELAQDGLCLMKYIDRQSTIKAGDIIVSSGNGGLFPVGRIIGTVKEIKSDDSGLSKNAVIAPVVDIDSVTSVFVITDFNGQGEGYAE
ncbi:MAG: rod shape-determining protein MreC [Oscillospiraceae bacterium]